MSTSILGAYMCFFMVYHVRKPNFLNIQQIQQIQQASNIF